VLGLATDLLLGACTGISTRDYEDLLNEKKIALLALFPKTTSPGDSHSYAGFSKMPLPTRGTAPGLAQTEYAGVCAVQECSFIIQNYRHSSIGVRRHLRASNHMLCSTYIYIYIYIFVCSPATGLLPCLDFGSLLLPDCFIWKALWLHFGSPWKRLADPGLPSDAQQDTLGSRSGFLWTWAGFGDPPGSHFADFLSIWGDRISMQVPQ